MEVEFADSGLAECFRNRSAGVRKWGPVVGARFGRAVDALYNAKDRHELAAIRSLRLHPLHGQREGQWALVLHDRWRIVVTFEGESIRIEEVTQHYGD